MTLHTNEGTQFVFKNELPNGLVAVKKSGVISAVESLER